jgi:pyruvate kinase
MISKKTKIVATLGLHVVQRDNKDMIDAGVNVFRVNFSHADYADVKEKRKSLEILMMSMDTLQYLETWTKLRVMNEGVI